MSQAEFKTAVCAKMSVFVNCKSSKFYLDVKSYGSFAEMQSGTPVKPDQTFQDEGTYSFGGQNDIVVVRAYYQWPTNRIFGSLSLQNMSNGERMIASSAAFRNEPFGTI